MPIQISTPLKADDSNAGPNNAGTDAYGKKLGIEAPRGANDQAFGKKGASQGRRSIFNAYHVYTGVKDGQNAPVFTDRDLSANREYLEPTIYNLIGRTGKCNGYDETDFYYCSRYGEIPNNRLVTLRRFPYPCADDISSSYEREPDVARMVTWFDQEDNKLSEIINMNFGMRWKTLESVSEQGSMIGDSQGAQGHLLSMLKVLDPQYADGAVAGENRLQYDPQHDQNKVYGPVNSITNTHIRDVGLNFEQPIRLKFVYELKSINGANPKAAFVDLLSNILAVTANNAKFWGGARYWVGYKPSSYAKKLRTLGNQEFAGLMSESHVDMKSYVGGIAQSLSDIGKSTTNIGQVLSNIGNLAFGKLLNKLGRTSIPVMNSLLTAEPVGQWHITIGNPLRPIITMGNMLLETTTITVGDETLGHDDFPKTIIVECALKHAMPRGRAEIESMFNSGKGRTYWKPTEKDLKTITSGPDKRSSMQKFVDHEIKWATGQIFDFAQM